MRKSNETLNDTKTDTAFCREIQKDTFKEECTSNFSPQKPIICKLDLSNFLDIAGQNNISNK